MNSCALTDKGIVRTQNQDSFYVSCLDDKNAAILIVCDGMGGARAGNVASDLACKVFSDSVRKAVERNVSDKDLSDAMKNALGVANTAVYELSCTDAECRGMGTTLVAAVARGELLTVLNVGDSRLYRISGGAIELVTRDHSVVEDMIQRGKITREESRNHPNKNLITRAVGTAQEVRSDVFTLTIKKGDRLLLCSDGLSNMLEDDEMLEIINSGGSTDDAAAELMKKALDRGAPDNVTLVLFQA